MRTMVPTRAASRTTRPTWLRRALLLLFVAAFPLLLAACDSDSGTEPVERDDTISEIVAGDAQFSTLLQVLQAAELVETFADVDATFTVFAPVNDAFAPYDVGVIGVQETALTEILSYHVIPNTEIRSSSLQDGQTVQTLAGQELRVRIDGSGTVFVDGSQVIATDIEAENGIVHVIDRVMVGNQNLANVVWFIEDLRTLYETVVAVDLGGAFAGADDWTVFAPDNEAFSLVDDALAGLSDAEVTEILQYHVLPGGITRSDQLVELLETNNGVVTVPTAQGETVEITLLGDGSISFNDGQATLDLENLDYFASNGIVHLIDGVLLPEAFRPTNTIADIVAGSDDFSTLLAAVDAADLVGALADTEATFTVFAPNDAAFAPINVDALLADPDALAAVLGYHVIPGEAIQSGNLVDGATVTTLSGDELIVNLDADGGVTIEGSRVITADVAADNGVIHVIDRALLGNQTLAGVVSYVQATETLLDVVVDFELAGAFVDAEAWTLFGPDNATFAAADLSGFTNEEITEVLLYHVFAEGVVGSADLVELLEAGEGAISISTLQGEALEIAVLEDGTIAFNGGQAVLDLDNIDYFGSNGVLHVIEGILLPPSLVDDAEADVTITVGNEGSSAWVIDGETNPTVSLAVGDRVRFDLSGVDSGFHPFALVGTGGSSLLSQGGGGSGSFVDDDAVNALISADEVTFTLTSGLAAELARYICTSHASMDGEITIGG